MNIEELRDFCLSIKGAKETFPFGDSTLVFKIGCNANDCEGGRIFALINLDGDNATAFVNLKCNPHLSLNLQEEYDGIKPAWHMNKRLWISVYLHADVHDSKIKELINHSVSQVISKMPKSMRENYLNHINSF